MPAMSPYEILGVTEDATEVQIRGAYLRLAKLHHPDLNPNDPGAAEKFNKIKQAYEEVLAKKKGINGARPFEGLGKGSFSFDPSHPFAAFYAAMKKHYKPGG